MAEGGTAVETTGRGETDNLGGIGSLLGETGGDVMGPKTFSCSCR